MGKILAICILGGTVNDGNYNRIPSLLHLANSTFRLRKKGFQMTDRDIQINALHNLMGFQKAEVHKLARQCNNAMERGSSRLSSLIVKLEHAKKQLQETKDNYSKALAE